MKKNYIAPETLSTKLRTEGLMQVASLTGQNLVDTNETVDAEEIESREIYYPKNYNVWDE